MSIPFTIERLDHLVLTVGDIAATIRFYTNILGMEAVTFGQNRQALAFGQQKINLHPASAPVKPHAIRPTPGSADLCLITTSPISKVIDHLQKMGITLEEGPVARTGAIGAITSVYLRDPDGNLIEISQYGQTPAEAFSP